MDSTTEKSLPQVVRRLYELTASWNETDDVPKSQQDEARVLGEDLNRMGGYGLMLATYDELHARNPCVCVLQAYWDNIGTWRW